MRREWTLRADGIKVPKVEMPSFVCPISWTFVGAPSRAIHLVWLNSESCSVGSSANTDVLKRANVALTISLNAPPRIFIYTRKVVSLLMLARALDTVGAMHVGAT